MLYIVLLVLQDFFSQTDFLRKFWAQEEEKGDEEVIDANLYKCFFEWSCSYKNEHPRSSWYIPVPAFHLKINSKSHGKSDKQFIEVQMWKKKRSKRLSHRFSLTKKEQLTASGSVEKIQLFVGHGEKRENGGRAHSS